MQKVEISPVVIKIAEFLKFGNHEPQTSHIVTLDHYKSHIQNDRVQERSTLDQAIIWVLLATSRADENITRAVWAYYDDYRNIGLSV